jgi:eukaryotic-like serine/threonine-protein kinase
VQKFDTVLPEATTPSIDALKAYSLGRKAQGADAVPAYQRAIRLDPNFAMAYAMLGDVDWNLGEKKLAAENVRKAYELRERVSDREKFFIESEYYATVTGDREAALRVFQLWAQTYPRDYDRNNLAYLYSELGHYEKALVEQLEALRIDPRNPDRYSSVMAPYLCLNRFEEARATAKQALAKNLDSMTLRIFMYDIAFLNNDSAGMAEQLAWWESAGKPVVGIFPFETAAYLGRLGNARESLRNAVGRAEREGLKEQAAGLESSTALLEAQFGNPLKARQRATAALALSNGMDVQSQAAMALAFTGETGKAQSLADDVERRFPENTCVRYNYLPTIRAQVALSQANAKNAIEILQAARPYDLGFMGLVLYPIYVRGEAYLAAKRGAEAAAEFQKILNHSGILVTDPIRALAHLQLGRAFAVSGDQAKAKAAYQDFLRLWKDADPDIPILRAAKAEYEKLVKGT